MYYNNYYESSTVFMASDDDLKKELVAEDIGKEFVFLKKAVYCPECGNNLKKTFLSQQKAEDYANKHKAYKTYSTHNPVVQEVEYEYEFTIADIAGTTANNSKLRNLRQNLTRGILDRANGILERYQKTIADLETIFGVTYRGSNIDDLVGDNISEIASVKLRFSNTEVYGSIDLEDLLRARDLIENRKEIYCTPEGVERDEFTTVEIEGFKMQGKVIDDVWERVHHMHFLMHLDNGSRFDRVYSWNYPYNFEPVMGANIPPQEPCPFCNKNIESWNDAEENIHPEINDYRGSKCNHKIVHKECVKHILESRNLYSYAEKLQEVVA